MAEFLSDEWLARLRGAGSADRSGGVAPAGTVQMVVTGAPGGDVKWFAVLVDGVITEAERGTNAAADVTLTASHAEARQMLTGELEPSVAYMRGRMKTAGDPGLVLDLLAAAAAPAARAWLERLGADTDA